MLCTWTNKITAKGVGLPHLGVAGRRTWSKTWEGPRTIYIIYTKWQGKTTPAQVGMNTCECLKLASMDLLGPNIEHAFMSQTRTG